MMGDRQSKEITGRAIGGVFFGYMKKPCSNGTHRLQFGPPAWCQAKLDAEPEAGIGWILPVYVLAVTDLENDDHNSTLVEGVKDSVDAYADPENVVVALELAVARWKRIGSKRLSRAQNTDLIRTIELAELTVGASRDFDSILRHPIPSP